MTKAQQLLASPEFSTLPLDVQNRLLMQALLNPEPVQEVVSTPQQEAISIQPEQSVIVHHDGQPFLLVPLQSDPTAGVSQPATNVMSVENVADIARATLGGVGDGLKTTVGLGLGAIGTIANLAVDLLTFGQSKSTHQVQK